MQRITITEVLEDEWFKKDYKPPAFDEKEDANLDDVEAVFKDSEVLLLSLRIYWFSETHVPRYLVVKLFMFFACRNIS